MDYDWNGKTIYEKKKPILKIKNSKNQREIDACEQNTTSEEANFCTYIVFSHYFKLRSKKFNAAKPLVSWFRFLFWRDPNHNSNLTSRIMKKCDQIFKKNSAPIHFKFFEL